VSNPPRRRDGHHRLKHMHQVEKDYRAARRLIRGMCRDRRALGLKGQVRYIDVEKVDV